MGLGSLKTSKLAPSCLDKLKKKKKKPVLLQFVLDILDFWSPRVFSSKKKNCYNPSHVNGFKQLSKLIRGTVIIYDEVV
jgi:hypothetical protein